MVEFGVNKKLAKKFYLYDIGFFCAVGSVMGLSFVFTQYFLFNPLVFIFVGCFLTVIWRALYDQLMIYELKKSQINFVNNVILAIISSCILTGLYYFLN